MDKISGRPGVRVDNELVIDAGSCEESVGVLEKYKRLRAVEVARRPYAGKCAWNCSVEKDGLPGKKPSSLSSMSAS